MHFHRFCVTLPLLTAHGFCLHDAVHGYFGALLALVGGRLESNIPMQAGDYYRCAMTASPISTHHCGPRVPTPLASSRDSLRFAIARASKQHPAAPHTLHAGFATAMSMRSLHSMRSPFSSATSDPMPPRSSSQPSSSRRPGAHRRTGWQLPLVRLVQSSAPSGSSTRRSRRQRKLQLLIRLASACGHRWR